jgi:ABC-2 type transport system permease protein
MLPIIFLVPVIQLLVLSYTATFEIKNVNLVVADYDKSPSSRDLAAKFEGSPFFTVVDHTETYAMAEEELINNMTDQILEIPQGFERDIITEKKASLLITTNAINGSAASLMNAYALNIIKEYNSSIIVEQMGLRQPPEPVRISSAFWYNPELDYFTYMVPGILVLLITVISAFLSAMNIVKEKEIGTIEQINVTPIRKYQFILGKMIPFWFIALFELAFGLLLAKLVFDIPMLGSLWVVFFMAGIYLFVALGLGLLISTVSNTQQQAMFLTWFLMVIFILMSGLFTPVQSMPEWAQWMNKINPIAYFIDVMRMVLLKGSSLGDITMQLFSLLALALVLNALAVWRYRKIA